MVKTIERLDELLSDDAVTSLLADGVEFSLRATNGSKAIQFHADDPGAEQALGWTGRAQDAGGRRTLAVTGAFDDIQLAQLALLAQLVPGADFERVPPQLPLADRLALRGVELVIEWAPFRLTSLVIRVASARPWTIVDGVFAVDDLEVAFVLSYPLERPAALSCRVDSVLKLGSAVSLDTHVDVPSLDVEIELADDQEVPLAPVLDRLFPGAGMPDLAFTYLHAEMSPRAQTYAFRGSLTGAWEVIPGAVALDALQLELSRTGLGRPVATVRGDLTLGGVPATLEATRAAGEPGGAASWQFAGGTREDASVPLGALAADFARRIDLPVPGFLDSLVLRGAGAEFASATGTLALRSDWQTDVPGLEGRVAFDLHPAVPRLGRVVVASYTNPDGVTQRVRDIVAGVSDELAAAIPAGLEVALHRAVFASCKSTAPAPASRALLGVDVGMGLDLSRLPLVGPNFAAGESLRMDYQVMAASGELTLDDARALEAPFAAQGVAFVPRAIPRGLDLRGTLRFGDAAFEFGVPVRVDPDTGAIVERPPSRTSPDDGAQWFDFQRSFGPVQLERVGVKFERGELALLLDASLGLGGLSLGLLGLSARSPITPISPRFSLDGLSLDYRQAGLAISGAFLRRKTTVGGVEVESYDGLASLETTIKGAALSLSAIGSYASYRGEPALFLYAVLGIPIGGPVFFSVEGLAAGFGYNRELRVPPIDQIAEFPLVAEAMSGELDMGDTASRAEVLRRKMDSLATYITPHIGAGFLAVGVKFSSFKMINAFALLTLSLGERFELHLLGLGVLRVPFSAGAADVDPLVQMQLALKASFLPDEGFLGVTAQLTPASFLLSRDCRLTGGYAFHTWFAGAHAGDFVMTLGGYHPRFQVPAHYPMVPRLGFNWRIGNTVSIKGEGYFALCAHALMAGGRLEVNFESGSAYAYFRANADFLIGWRPFHYDIEVNVGIGAGYGFLGPVDLSVGLRLWGPEFGGHAKVKVVLFSFTIDFGDQSSRYPKAISWDEFRAGFLPAGAPARRLAARAAEDDSVCSVTVAGGLVRRVQDGGDDLWVVNPQTFTLATDAVIPMKRAFRGTATAETPLELGGGSTAFGIRPMAIAAKDVSTTQRITITRPGGAAVDHLFRFDPVRKKVPSAVWGEPRTIASHPDRLERPRTDDAPFVTTAGAETVTGFQITPKDPPPPGQSENISTDVLQFDVTEVPGAIRWSAIPPFAASDLGDAARRTRIRETLGDNAIRRTMLAALGFDAARDVAIDPDTLARSFVLAPQIQ